MEKKVTLKVFRFDPEVDRDARYDSFAIPYDPKLSVLEALFSVLEKQDGSLAFRFSCRGAVCGSCALYINGSFRLACETTLSALKSATITVNPLPHLPVIKDLVVDMTSFFEKYERIMPYLQAQGAPERERRQSPRERKKIDEMVNCILCGCCYSSCPVVWMHSDYLGPHALTKAYRFAADSRDEALGARLSLVSGEDGVWRCHTVLNCIKACPKKVNPTYSIGQLKKLSLARRLGLGGK